MRSSLVEGEPRAATRRVRRVVGAVAGAALAAALLVTVLPRVTSVPWSAVLSPLAALTPGRLALLATVWLAGLCVHTIVLTAAQPRLTHRRALTLNLTGSAVAGLVPLGGAAGVGLNYLMARVWGFSAQSFAVYTAITNLCDIAAKFALAIAGLLLVLLAGNLAAHLMVAAAAAMVAVGLLVLLAAVVLVHADAAARLGSFADRVRCQLPGGSGVPEHRFQAALAEFRTVAVGRIKTAWPALSFGMIGYCLLQLELLWLTFHVLGVDLGLVPLVAAYALERVLTLAFVTPGGTGFAEIGMTSLLIALHGDPVLSTAGVLLYRAFTFGLEIPVGSAVLLGWAWSHRHALIARRWATAEGA